MDWSEIGQVILALMVLAGAFTILSAVKVRENDHNDGLRARFESHFRACVRDSDDPRLRFDGHTATIVRDREESTSGRQDRLLMNIERYARNEAGEYFIFLCGYDGKPFVKHVEQNIAKIVLGDDYIAPPAL